jgi:hypothetical protein
MGLKGVAVDVGYALLIAAVVPAAIGWDLSRRGLNDTGAAANAAKVAANELRATVAGAQGILADASGADAQHLAQTNAAATVQAASVEGAIGQVNDALSALTGRFAPARVAFALALLLVLSSLIAFDIVSVDLGSGSAAVTTSQGTNT